MENKAATATSNNNEKPRGAEAFCPAPLWAKRPTTTLLTKTELGDQGTIARNITALEIIKHAATLADHLQKATARGVILRVGLEVLGEVVDTLCEQCNLYLWRARVFVVLLVLVDDRCFLTW